MRSPHLHTLKHPLDLAGSFKAHVLGLYGGHDERMALTIVNQMKDAMAGAAAQGKQAAAAVEFVVYLDAPHAFHADDRPSYRKEEAADGFAKALVWFKTDGVA